MTIEQVAFRDNLVVRDSAKTWRWYDALGNDVVKKIENFESLAIDDTTGDPVDYTATVVEIGAGDSTIALTTTKGGAALITAAANENDGAQYQLVGEAFQLNAEHRCYFGIKLQGGDVDQSDFIAGLCITDTTLLTALSDGAYFRSIDGAATVQFIIEKDSVESSTSVATMADATDITLEWFFDGTNITAYVNGAQVAQVAVTDTAFPDNEVLTPSLAFLTGEAVANTLTVQWMRSIQVQN